MWIDTCDMGPKPFLEDDAAVEKAFSRRKKVLTDSSNPARLSIIYQAETKEAGRFLLSCVWTPQSSSVRQVCQHCAKAIIEHDSSRAIIRVQRSHD